MGILDNLENAWDADFLFESKPMPVTDNMGREEPNLAVKLFSETCCTDCSCKNGQRSTTTNSRASTSNLIISD